MRLTSLLAASAGFALISGVSSAPALAEVVTFENLPAGSCYYLGASATSGSFGFATESAGNALFACDAFVNGKNPTRALVDANGTANTAMTRIGGGAFSLTSFEAGSRSADYNNGVGFTDQSSAAIRVTGLLTAGGTVVQEFLFTGTDLGNRYDR